MEQNQTEKPKKKRKNGLLIVLLIVCILVLAFAGYKIYEILSEWGEGTETYSKIAEQYVAAEEVAEGEEQEINFVKLQEENPLVTSWIRIDGTRISYPIAQTDNNSYYLNHLIDGTKNKNGTIFIDCRNAADFSDKNTLIYGHHMKNGAMFGTLVEYQHQDYYEQHPFVRIDTPEQKFIGEIFSAYICAADADAYELSFLKDGAFEKHIREAKKNSLIHTDVEVSAEDRIVTLSTCTYEYDNARFVVIARLIPAEEQEQ